MAVLPQDRLASIQFCEDHVNIWAAAPATAVGLTAAQVESLTALTDEARNAYNAAQAARQASKAATVSYNAAVREMRTLAGDMISQIKAFADLSANPSNVYSVAQIPPPAPPTPATAPGKPSNISIVLQPTGAITLNWEATNAAASSGGFFNVFRKLPGQTNFLNIGGAPGSTSFSRSMSFTDGSVPTSAAAQGAQYIIQGQRGTLTGTPSDAVTVQFGTDGLTTTLNGSFSVNGQSQPMKIAA